MNTGFSKATHYLTILTNSMLFFLSSCFPNLKNETPVFFVFDLNIGRKMYIRYTSALQIMLYLCFFSDNSVLWSYFLELRICSGVKFPHEIITASLKLFFQISWFSVSLNQQVFQPQVYRWSDLNPFVYWHMSLIECILTKGTGESRSNYHWSLIKNHLEARVI